MVIWFRGLVTLRWFLGHADGVFVSLQRTGDACVFPRLIQCLFRFPQEPLKLSVPGNNYMFPRGSPNIQGIRRHLACKSLFLSLTLCIAFYFPLSSSVAHPILPLPVGNSPSYSFFLRLLSLLPSLRCLPFLFTLQPFNGL